MKPPEYSPPSISSAPAGARGHLSAIDGVRGAAVLLVVVAHTILMRPLNAFDQILADVLGAGWCGVDLFFVLSGFLITGILFDAKKGRHYFRSFYVRRTLRIFPVYYLSLLLLLIVLPRIAISQADAYRSLAEHQAWFWLHLSNFHFAQNGFTGDATDVFWSLAIEEQFYLVWPLVVWRLGRKALMRICVGLIAGAFMLRVGMCLMEARPVAIYVLPFARMDGLAAGGLVALMIRGGKPLSALLPGARMLSVACIMGLTTIICFAHGLPIWGRATQMFGYTLLVGLFAATLVLVLNDEPRSFVRRFFDTRILRTFGRYSYAIYIAHLPVRMIVRTLGFDLHAIPPVMGSNLPGQLLFTLAVIVITLGLAVVSWHVLEKRVLALKRFFPYEGPSPDRGLPEPRPVAASWIADQPALR